MEIEIKAPLDRKQLALRLFTVFGSLALTAAAYYSGSVICAYLAGWLACCVWRVPVVEPVPKTADEIVETFNAMQARNQ